MHKMAIAVLAGLAAHATSGAGAAERLVTGGVVRGQDMADGGTVFRGIPYAAAPVGALRFGPPAPVVPWSGLRDATLPPPPCLQHNEGWNADDAAKSREDCLYLSIRAPRHQPTDRLPVMFWIHGGSNRAGSGSGYVESAIHLRGVVLVSIEYRLGVFGFLASPELSAGSPEHASGNEAILDQIAALGWVKDNIANFGGDPNNVTIFGQSAGAYDVGFLLLSPLARGLFQRAVLESGNPGLVAPPRTAAENERLGTDLAALVGVKPGQDALAALRAAPAQDLLVQGDKLVPPDNLSPDLLWGQATVDGYVLRDAPTEILAKDEEAHVPLIIGNIAREFSVEASPQAARQMIVSYFGKNADAALALYGLKPGQPVVDDPVLGNAATQFVTDLIFRCPANRLAAAVAAAGRDVWRYQFGVAAPGGKTPLAHNADLKYVFDAPALDATFGSWPPLQQYWTNFARGGNPNAAGLPYWPSYASKARYMDFTPQGPKSGADPRGAICRLMNG